MAERTVSTLLKIDGEQEYNNALRNIQREQNALKSSVKLLDEQFKGQSNSLAALTAKQQALSSLNDAATRKVDLVRGAYEKSQAAVKEYTAKIEALRAKIAAEGDAEGKLAKQLETAEINLQKAQNATVKYGGDVSKAELEVAKINNQIKDNARYLDEAKRSANGTATSIDEYGKTTAKARSESENLGKTGKEAFDRLAQALIAAGLIRGVTELIDIMKRANEEFIQFESAAAGVDKTFKGTPEQLAAVIQSIKDMSTVIPIATGNIAKLVEIGGQLSVPVDDLARFAEVMSAIGVSTDITAETAAISIAQLTGITETSSKMFSNFGSSLIALGNDSKTFESKILDMAMGLAAAGKQIGLSDADILAFAATLSSKGVEAQAGGTAMSRMMQDLAVSASEGAEGMAEYADIAGMTAEQFYQMFNSDAIGAINAFFNGIASGGESAVSVLRELGVTEMRQLDAMLRLSTSQDILRKYVDLSNGAYAENTALMTEAEKRYETTESKIQLLKNATNLLGITIGEQLNPSIRESIQAGTDIIGKIDEFLQQNPWAVQAVIGLAAALATLAVALGGTAIAFSVVIPAIKAFQVAIGAASAGAVMGGIAIAALAVGLIAAAAASGDATQEFKEQSSAIQEITSSVKQNTDAHKESLKSIESQQRGTSALIDKLSELSEGYSGSTYEQNQMKAIIEQLNQEIDGLNLTFDANTGKISENTAAIRERAGAQYEAAKADAYNQRYTQLLLDQADAQYALEKAHDAYLNVGEKGTSLQSRLWKQYKDQYVMLGDIEDQLKWTEEKIKSSSEATKDATSTTEDNTSALEDSAEAAKALAEEHESIKNRVGEAADRVADFGDKLDGAKKKSIDFYIKGEESQAKFWENYRTNLEKAREMGVGEGLMAELAEPTEKNAQTLDSIVSGSLEKIQQLNDAYAARQEARALYVEEMAREAADAAQLIEQLANDTTISEAAASNVTEAKKAMLDKVKSSKFVEVAKTIIEETVGELEDSSVLQRWYEAGAAFAERCASGLAAHEWIIVEEAKRLAAAANAAFFSNIQPTLYGPEGPGAGSSYISTPKGPVKRKPFKTGLDYVPYDEFPANLHEGEAVLTKVEAMTWRAMKDAARGATPMAADLATINRPMTARDVGKAVNGAIGSIQGGKSVVFKQYNTSPQPLDAYETERLARKALRKIK